MRKRLRQQRKRKMAFTLLEILVVIAILATLFSLSYPAALSAISRGKSALCASNLRSIGVAVNSVINDNNGQYPAITQGGSLADYPAGSGAQTLYVTLQPYGILPSALMCPCDVGNPTYASQNPQTSSPPAGSTTNIGSSYEWSPALDDEASAAPVLYARGAVIPVNASKVRLCMDGGGWHRGRYNRLYADGHVIQN